jgi:hypothetical protein
MSWQAIPEVLVREYSVAAFLGLRGHLHNNTHREPLEREFPSPRGLSTRHRDDLRDSDPKIIEINGKTSRRSHDRGKARNPPHLSR